MENKFTPKQINAIECALADLKDSAQAHEQGDSNIHDWESHAITIDELIDTFHFLKVPAATLEN